MKVIKVAMPLLISFIRDVPCGTLLRALRTGVMAARLILGQLVEVRVLGPQLAVVETPAKAGHLRAGRSVSAGASMGALGLEPRILGLKGRRSNQLSYTP